MRAATGFMRANYGRVTFKRRNLRGEVPVVCESRTLINVGVFVTVLTDAESQTDKSEEAWKLSVTSGGQIERGIVMVR